MKHFILLTLCSILLTTTLAFPHWNDFNEFEDLEEEEDVELMETLLDAVARSVTGQDCTIDPNKPLPKKFGPCELPKEAGGGICCLCNLKIKDPRRMDRYYLCNIGQSGDKGNI